MYELFTCIKETFFAASKHYNKNIEEKYYIQCWLNTYQKGEYIDWHDHGDPKMNSWHGFYCLQVEPNSFTTYKLPQRNNETVVHSQNNLIVLGPTNGDIHRSSEWNEPYARITIAFDITPARMLFERNLWQIYNHWIPL
jgi:hypothetical protein